jgi:glycosyltransferase involved in cell wall biosynthesis
MLPRQRGLVFVTSVPYTFGQEPWVIEIEDAISLFYPFVQNGKTSKLKIGECPYLPILRKLLEADNCRGIITHIRSTAESLPTLLGSEIIGRKTTYVPLGVKLPRCWQRHDDEEYLDLLFTCSWHQNPESFFLRGGLEVLDAFAICRERYPFIRLTLRSGLPYLRTHYHRILERGWVRVVNRYLPPVEMETLLRKSHVFLLPAARIHIVSILKAMSFGQVVVASDGWGIEEYVSHERNGLIVNGRYGKVSWMDKKTGLLRENYRPMHRSDPIVVQNLVDAISRLAEDQALRRRLGRNARRDVETTYSLDNWNRGLKAALDKARGLA